MPKILDRGLLNLRYKAWQYRNAVLWKFNLKVITLVFYFFRKTHGFYFMTVDVLEGKFKMDLVNLTVDWWRHLLLISLIHSGVYNSEQIIFDNFCCKDINLVRTFYILIMNSIKIDIPLYFISWKKDSKRCCDTPTPEPIHQIWRQTWFSVCFHLWCELTLVLWCHSIVWSLFSWNKM